jgi:hypothetical protein
MQMYSIKRTSSTAPATAGTQPESHERSSTAQTFENRTNSPSFGRLEHILLVSETRSSALLTESIFVGRGFRLTDCRPSDVLELDNFDQFTYVILSTSRSRTMLSTTFEAVEHINQWRFREARHVLPELWVLPLAELPGPIAADFTNRCCRVVLPNRDVLLQTLETAKAERLRLETQGPTIFILNINDVFRVLLVGIDGTHSEMFLSGRELRLLRKLASENRSFTRPELARVMGCTDPEVQVYVQRIRDEFDRRKSKLGICLGREELIKNWGKGYGYRLHARIKYPA